ncbi:hypothetical protein RvY_06326 [Ramazzottius varieornatus]|uniref:Uncharacterized protein n=1 Tax=Ramazzottius varieornatus TaxID=947166 RepID=A0A1D1UY59_RAMVA|nr:hypothetical protein RvY_06326 [Ramazzottius varieornatus]
MPSLDKRVNSTLWSSFFQVSNTDRAMPPWPHWPLVYHCLTLVIVALQAACLDYYLVSFNYDPKHESASYWWITWIVADVLVLALMIATFFLSRKYLHPFEKRDRNAERRNGEATKCRRSRRGHLGILPHAWIVWLLYALVLVGKIISIFQTFGSGLVEKDVFGINLLEFTLGGTAAVFMLILSTRPKELATAAQRHYLRWMQHFVLLEIIDCAEFLTLLFTEVELGTEVTPLPEAMRRAILAFASINILAPTLALYRLSARHNRRPEKTIWRNFYLAQTVVGTIFGNLPYFVIRVILWHDHEFVTGLFAMKNLIMIVTDGRELSAYVRDLRKGRHTEDYSESGSSDEEEEDDMTAPKKEINTNEEGRETRSLKSPPDLRTEDEITVIQNL